jgi:hypothetical protein
LKKNNFYDVIRLLSENAVGRKQAWDFFRVNLPDILLEYTLDDSRIGQALIDISRTFETEYLFYELVQFVTLTAEFVTFARFKAIEIVSTNVVWLLDKEQEIIDAFSSIRNPPSSSSLSWKKYFKREKSQHRKRPDQFLTEAKAALAKFNLKPN